MPKRSSPPADTPSKPARMRRTTAREPLTRERIAHAALVLIDEAGLEGLTMRALGAALGVEAMALYHHVADKGALLDAVVERLLDEVVLPDPSDGPVEDRLRACLRSYRALAVSHPRAFVLMAARRFNTPRAFAVYERLLSMYAEMGLAPKRQAWWFRLMGGFASGAGMAYAASVERVADATPLALQHAPVESIPFPHVRAVAPHLRVDGLDAAFEFGLQVLMDALARDVAEREGERPKPQRTRSSARR